MKLLGEHRPGWEAGFDSEFKELEHENNGGFHVVRNSDQ